MVFDSSPACGVAGHAVSWRNVSHLHRLRVGNRLPSFWRENQRVESTGNKEIQIRAAAKQGWQV